jgi:hypothetical protein
MTTLSKDCPKCGGLMTYTHRSNLLKSIRLNLTCTSCSHKNRPYEFLLTTLRHKAKKRNVPCNITYQEFVRFTDIKSCSYCGCDIEWQPHARNRRENHYNYYLDRIDSNRGYSVKNCCVCCPMCNGVKSNVFTHDEMLLMGKTIRKIKNIRHV